jgi:Arsenical pump membrane protein
VHDNLIGVSRKRRFGGLLAERTHRRQFCRLVRHGWHGGAYGDRRTAVLLTPVVLTLTDRLRLRPLPFALLSVWLANAASLLLAVSNLTNLLALQREHLSTLTFAGRMALPELAAVAITVGYLAAAVPPRPRRPLSATSAHSTARSVDLPGVCRRLCRACARCARGRPTMGGRHSLRRGRRRSVRRPPTPRPALVPGPMADPHPHRHRHRPARTHRLTRPADRAKETRRYLRERSACARSQVPMSVPHRAVAAAMPQAQSWILVGHVPGTVRRTRRSRSSCRGRPSGADFERAGSGSAHEALQQLGEEAPLTATSRDLTALQRFLPIA